MNKKVFISMLVLTMAFIVALYVLKIFYPQEFMLVIQNERLVAIGSYIDTHEWLLYLFSGITAFIIYYLYCCACKHSLFLKPLELLMIICTIVICRIVNFWDTTTATAISMASFIYLPAFMKGCFKTSAIVYTIHLMAQAMSLWIRNLPIYLTNVNSLTLFVFGFESYLWLFLLYVIFNYKKQEV